MVKFQKQHKKKSDNQKFQSASCSHPSSDTDDDNLPGNLHLPYDIKSSDIMGRYLVAARPLKPGDLIISELPLALGPCSDSDPVCLGCYQPIDYPFLDSQYK